MKKRHIKSIALIVLVIVMLANILVPVFAVNTKTTLRVGYIDYNGFIDKLDDGTYSGYAVEYLNEISKYTNYNFEYVYGTWEDLLIMLKNQQIDLLCNAQYTEERAESFDYTTSEIGYTQGLLYTRENNDNLVYEDYDTFNGMSVGVLKDNAMTDFFYAYAEKNGFTFNAVSFATDDEMTDALNSGEVDAICSEHLSNHQNLSLLARFGADPYYIISYKNSPYIKSINTALAQIKTNVDFESNLYHKYYDDSSAATSLKFTIAERNFIQQCGTITVGLNLERYPFAEYDEQTGEFHGICIDVMNKISEITGLKFEFKPMTVGVKAVDLLASGEYGILCGIERDNFALVNNIDTTEAFLESSVVPVGRAGENIDLHQNLRVAVPSSYQALQKQLAKDYPNLEIIKYDNNRDCLDSVLNGETDVFVQNTHLLSSLLQEPKYEKLDTMPVSIMTEHTAIAVPDTMDPMLLSILNKAIENMGDAVIGSSLIEHTFANPYKMTFFDILYKFKVQVIIIAILLLACFGLMFGVSVTRKRNAAILEKKNLQLGDAIEQAQRANSAKSSFLARMSHEIRTPMNAIVGITEIARHYENDPEKVNEYLDKIDISSKVLLNIINDVLDMSAIESNKIHIGSTLFDLKELINGISTMYYTQCKDKGVDFDVNVDGVTEEYVVGDSLRVNQILLNLMSNAFKFTPAGGSIKFKVSQKTIREGKVFMQFTVSDTGCGMSEDMLSRLFKPFEQESTQTASKHGGSGLGLSIAKNLTEMMQGKISVESKKDVGTTFTVDIPFVMSDQHVESDEEKMKTLRALIVDDDHETCEYTSTVLDRIGVTHDIAHSGDEALSKLQEMKEQGSGYDVCFVDWQMPGKNGIDVTKKIRELYDNDSIVIIVSAYDLSEVADEAKEAGASMLVTKPLFQSTVFNVLMTMSGGKFTKKTADETEFDFSGKKLLIAEDTELNREIAVELLTMVGFEVDCAVDGKQALDMFEKSAHGEYDVILMDVQMPIMDGYEATRAIRKSQHSDAKTIPIYAMTANAFSDDVAAALSSGMNGHIAKPIDTRILYKTLKTALQKGNG